ncbi:hypothetical protein NBRC110019_32210 [Neptunitalea chrysea]|uniref:Glucose/Sorbosone dehydrogenase domain-containing protein n=1 Tax=Neptunitalea chrysea TaxID=1647581 RepID=A0A9W6B934_9FLAO|nr:PQQ-dependent sugar dehydrogenase [Neptunitalea chrysea]GLB54180.1 hypothetical protein NBRC110019_32210 [Neptunitalea chrysea]
MNKFILLICIASLIACTTTTKSKGNLTVVDTKEKKLSEPIPATSNTKYTTELVVDGFNIPWGVTFLPDSSMLVTEKSGELYWIKNGEKTEITGMPQVFLRGQGGLLDIAAHPDYATNGFIYFTYASPEGKERGGNTALARAQIKNNAITNFKVLYKAAPNTTKSYHFGSRIAFDGKGHIFFTAGERGNRDENPQDITRDNGKVYRLNEDGSIPANNPFYAKNNAKKAIYSYGHRNPQGLFIHPVTGEIWEHEHGPQGGDEINIIKEGANYGWPIVTYGENYNGTPITDERTRPEFEDPIYYWVPSIAPSGFTYVSSEKYLELQGNLLVGSLKFQYLEHLVLDRKNVTKREKLIENIGRVRNVVQGPDGFIYVAVEGTGIMKLVHK